MTRTINMLYDAIKGLRTAQKSLVEVEVRFLDDGQKTILFDAIDRIEDSIRELIEIENELRFGKVWTEPS